MIDLFSLWQVHFRCTCLLMGVLLTLSLKCWAFISLLLFWFCFSRRSLAQEEGAECSLWLPCRGLGEGDSSPHLIHVVLICININTCLVSLQRIVFMWDGGVFYVRPLCTMLWEIPVSGVSLLLGNIHTTTASRLKWILPLFCLVTGERDSCRP